MDVFRPITAQNKHHSATQQLTSLISPELPSCAPSVSTSVGISPEHKQEVVDILGTDEKNSGRSKSNSSS